MNVLLWRHAEAEDGWDDLARPLTEHGKAQSHSAAEWLRRYAPPSLEVLVSPATRTRQTVESFTTKYRIVQELAPGGSLAQALDALSWPSYGKDVLLVGHQPTVGQIASFLVIGQPKPWSFGKGAIWWLSQEGGGAAIRSVLDPDLDLHSVRAAI